MGIHFSYGSMGIHADRAATLATLGGEDDAAFCTSSSAVGGGALCTSAGNEIKLEAVFGAFVAICMVNAIK